MNEQDRDTIVRRNIETALRFLEGTHGGDPDVIDDTVDPGIVTHGFPGGFNPASRAEYRAFFETLERLWADMAFEIETVVADTRSRGRALHRRGHARQRRAGRAADRAPGALLRHGALPHEGRPHCRDLAPPGQPVGVRADRRHAGGGLSRRERAFGPAFLSLHGSAGSAFALVRFGTAAGSGGVPSLSQRRQAARSAKKSRISQRPRTIAKDNEKLSRVQMRGRVRLGDSGLEDHTPG